MALHKNVLCKVSNLHTKGLSRKCMSQNIVAAICKQKHRWTNLGTLEHHHPAALKGLGKPFDAALEKKVPHPSPILRP